MSRLIGALALFAALVPAAAAAQEDGFQRPAVSAEDMVALFGRVCLDALPDFSASDRRLTELGFGEADDAGFRLHESQPLAAMALPKDDAEPPAMPTCLVLGARAEFAGARDGLDDALDGRGEDLRALQSTAVELDHRIWLWREDGRQLQLVLAEDGRGNLTAVLSVLPEEAG